MGFSNQNREEIKYKVKGRIFDLLIIGGGLTGASLALDAATRGMSTVLLERSDFASAGSERHSLLTTEQKNYDYKTWKQLEREKSIIQTSFAPLYQSLTGVHLKYRGDQDIKSLVTVRRGILFPFKRKQVDQSLELLRKRDVLKMAPLVNQKDLERGIQFENGLISRSLMTIELLKKANQFGASPLNYFKVIQFIYDDNKKIIGVRAQDQINGQIVSFYAHRVINATGQDLNHTRQLDQVDKKGDYAPTVYQETQFQVKLEKQLLEKAISFNYRKNNRFMTVVPFNKRLIVTVTEPVEQSGTDTKDPETEDIKRYLALCRQVIESDEFKLANVEHVYRSSVAKYQRKSSPNELVDISESGLISVIGTSTLCYRLYASQIIDLIAKRFKQELNVLYSESETETIAMNKNRPVTKNKLLASYDHLSISDQQIIQLLKHYGNETEKLLAYFEKTTQAAEHYQIDHLLCTEIVYAIVKTAVYTPLDFFIRRARLDYELTMIKEQLPGILALFADQLPWTKEERSYFERELRIWLTEQLN